MFSFHSQMEVGVVYDPCADELYQAVRGFGAFVNGRRASSSDCTELGNAVVVRCVSVVAVKKNKPNTENLV